MNRKKFCGMLLLLVCFCGISKGGVSAVKILLPISDSILYKNIQPRLLQRTTGLDDMTIVVPQNSAWGALADSLKTIIDKKGANKILIRQADSAKFSSGWTGNTIIIGNLANNYQMARLYGLRMSYADAVYLGDGGYQLLTLIDPFGVGGNTLIVAASDLSGARLGVALLSQLLMAEKGNSIPWLFETRLSLNTAAYFDRSQKTEK